MSDIREALRAANVALEEAERLLSLLYANTDKCHMYREDIEERCSLINKARICVNLELAEIALASEDGWRDMAPNWAGQFDTFDKWASGAHRRLDKYAVCIDAKGRRCVCGADFMRARDENAFPIRYFWDCQPPEGK